MRIVITGTPGTGKSAVARRLSKMTGLPLVDIKSIARKARLVSAKRKEVDIPRLARSLSFLRRRKGFVAEGHLACETRLPADFIVVLRCDPRILKGRLSRRGYGPEKLEENLMAEMLDYCAQRAYAVYRRNVLELDTSSRSAEESAREIGEAIRHKRKRIDNVDYSDALIRHLVK